MLTARSVIIAVLIIATLSLIGAMISLMQPLDQGGFGEDTYGTRAYGYRAIFDVLAELGVHVERGLGPPDRAADPSATLVLWAPQDDLVRAEPVYLQRVAEYVQKGSRLIVALPVQQENSLRWRRGRHGEDFVKDTTAPKELGFAGIDTTLVDLSAPPETADEAGKANADRARRPDRWETFKPRDATTRQLKARFEGDLAGLSKFITILEVPEKIQALELDEEETESAGILWVDTSDNRTFPLAAQFKFGAGDVIFVSDPAIFDNRLIGRGDNSVLAVHLTASAGKPVVWDEFYHGLTIRGNPLFLLTRRSYAILAMMFALGTTAWIWRQAIFLGPPLAAPVPSRRTLREYVDAMARLFRQGAGSRRFMVEEVKQGVLWTLLKRHGSQRTKETPQDVAEVVARHDPQLAHQLLDAARAADLMSDKTRPTEREVLQIAKGLADCL